MTQTETRSPHFGREAAASTYRDIHLPRIFTPWAKILLEIVTPREGEAVLDVATGPGTVARPAAKAVGPTGRVVGVDFSPAMLGVARSFAAEAGAAPIEYLEASATSIPLENDSEIHTPGRASVRIKNSFDVAYCQQGLQHMSDPSAALKEIRRLLKPGGRLGLAAWHQSPFGLFREVAANMGIQSEGAQPSNFGREPDDLAEAVRAAGFEGVEVQQRELISVLEGGVPQALELALATSASGVLQTLSSEQQDAFRAALARAAERHLRDGAVHLKSVSNIVSAHRGL